MRLILHPGFHKTGTSSLQACLAANRNLLAPFCRIVLEGELAAPLRAASRYCQGQDPLDLASFSARFGEVCLGLSQESVPAIVISCEGLSGRTPGKNGIRDYGAAPALARAMGDAARAVFGRRTDLQLVYTTRQADAWLYSAWRHNLWGYPVTEDFAAFRTRYAAAADFDAVVEAIRRQARGARLASVALEDCTTGLGPAEAVLRCLDLPGDLRARLKNPGPRNIGRSAELSAELLALNRSGLAEPDLKEAKAALLRSAPDQ